MIELKMFSLMMIAMTLLKTKTLTLYLVEIISLFLNDLFQIKPVMMIIIMIDDDDTRNIARRSGLIDVD